MTARDADLEAEQEVDLGRYWSAIVARWWLLLAGLFVGALIGYLVSLSGKQVWEKVQPMLEKLKVDKNDKEEDSSDRKAD